MNFRQVELRRHRLADSVGVYDIAEQRVAAGGHGGQRLAKRIVRPAFGMQVPDAIHGGQMNHVQVHQVIVVGQQIVGPPIEPAGVIELQHELIAVLHRGVHSERFVDVAGVVPRRGIPPVRTAPQDDAEDRGGEQHGPARGAYARAIRLRAGLQLGLAYAGAHHCDQAENQQQAERDQDGAHGFLHTEHTRGERGDGHRERPFAARAVHVHAHFPGTGGHQPEASGIELRIFFGGAAPDRGRAQTAVRPSGARARCGSA